MTTLIVLGVLVLICAMYAIIQRLARPRCSFCKSREHGYATCPQLMMTEPVPEFPSALVCPTCGGPHGHLRCPVIAEEYRQGAMMPWPTTTLSAAEPTPENTTIPIRPVGGPTLYVDPETLTFHNFKDGSSGGGGVSADWPAPDVSPCDSPSVDAGGACDAGGGGQ